ncbi:MAG TPA: dihydrodipicolinate synthase family protein [Terriglobia bacterium]|nr:dihydrodipicolinate synthase family protein [Terriglobia bacterium]
MKFTLEEVDKMRRPHRKIQGISAVLLPYTADGRIDETGFRRHLQRTLKVGLRVAVNMDTGYGDLLTAEEKKRALAWTAESVQGRDEFIAGVLPPAGSKQSAADYAAECERIRQARGVPIIFPSGYTAQMDDAGLAKFFAEIARTTDRFLAFELGAMFNPNGRMFSEAVLRSLMETPQCVGLKHSSLDRVTELLRLQLRDRLRPDFTIYTGNDLAADMVEFGSDYLLGLSTFAPELFAARDRAWEEGSAEYLELRDAIQYLGWVGFREPVPAYKHSAAIFLKLTGGLESDEPHPRAPRREAWDRELLADAARRLKDLVKNDYRHPAL